ncbi:MAG TPA: PEP-utilizing enzyme, partial [Campylobacterales bacterium]|nr:PEP-utilizing enzyme [Campylobacterales bacterium]
TCYGGANSHMAVRCSELGIPAVIGAGEAAYGKYAKSKKIEIDASGRVCRVIA